MKHCFACSTKFSSKRALSLHYFHNSFCNGSVHNLSSNPLIDNSRVSNDNATTSYQSIMPPLPLSIIGSNKSVDYSSDNNEDNNVIYDDESDGSIASQNSNLYYDNDIFHEISLIKLLNDFDAPLYAFNNIMNWARNATTQKYSFNNQQKTYKQVINHLEKKMYFGSGTPTEIPVRLYGDNVN